jgi:hypothetical protein
MKPAIGQIVLHRDRELIERPALITNVGSDESVNLQVFLDASQDEKLLSEDSNTVLKTGVPHEIPGKETAGDCWRFREGQQDWDMSCDCCGAAWVDSNFLQGFPCNCMLNRYCSTCMYCEEHCECGPDQDLQPDFVDATFRRIARLAAKEELPEVRLRIGNRG